MKIFRKWKESIYRRLLEGGLIAPKIVVLIDGGVCSQMHQYLLGQLYAGCGYKVVYDLSFYDELGLDKDRKFVRNFDLLKAFPYLEFNVASPTEIGVYRRKYHYIGNNTTARIDDFSFLEKVPPVYLGGYYLLPADVWLPAFHFLFRMTSGVLDTDNMRMCNEIDSQPYSVGVHVRRGDLKVEQYDYGMPPTLEYYKRAVDYFIRKFENSFFFFFSDEPEWVADELIPYLKLSTDECKVVDINGSDRGYMDLFLIAHCKHQITSKGTLGKYGALLQDSPEKVVILCDDKLEYRYKELLQNTVFL